MVRFLLNPTRQLLPLWLRNEAAPGHEMLMRMFYRRDQSMKRRGPDPSRMTFKDRQRMFQGGTSSPTTKPKSSRKLLELEESLRGQI